MDTELSVVKRIEKDMFWQWEYQRRNSVYIKDYTSFSELRNISNMKERWPLIIPDEIVAMWRCSDPLLRNFVKKHKRLPKDPKIGLTSQELIKCICDSPNGDLPEENGIRTLLTPLESSDSGSKSVNMESYFVDSPSGLSGDNSITDPIQCVVLNTPYCSVVLSTHGLNKSQTQIQIMFDSCGIIHITSPEMVSINNGSRNEDAKLTDSLGFIEEETCIRYSTALKYFHRLVKDEKPYYQLKDYSNLPRAIGLYLYELVKVNQPKQTLQEAIENVKIKSQNEGYQYLREDKTYRYLFTTTEHSIRQNRVLPISSKSFK